MNPIDVEDLARPLPAVRAALRKALPAAGILGAGIGLRVRESTGHVLRQVVVRVVVRRKLRPLPRGTPRIPGVLTLRSRYLGQRVSIRVPTDVQQRARAQPTFYAIDVSGQPGRLTAGAYATWSSDGPRRLGVISAGHGCWEHPGSEQHLSEARVDLGPGCDHGPLRARIVAASHMKRDGVDVALLDLGKLQQPAALDPCLVTLWKNTRIADARRLQDMLGGRGDGVRVDSTFKHFLVQPGTTASLAWFDRIPVLVAGWGGVTFDQAVETRGAPASFLPGTSGMGIVTRGSAGGRREALALQSVCMDPATSGGLWRWSLGTSIWRAREWLSERMGTVVDLHWDLADIRP